jgi:hypothetical protein
VAAGLNWGGGTFRRFGAALSGHLPMARWRRSNHRPRPGKEPTITAEAKASGAARPRNRSFPIVDDAASRLPCT